MELGLLPESSLKNVSFVSLSDDSRRTIDVDAANRELHPVAKSSDLETNDREDVASKSTSGALWPFTHTTRGMQTLTKSIRKRSKKKSGWSTKRRWKSKDAASEIARRRINDTMADLSIERAASSHGRKLEENPSMSNSSARLSESNFSLMQLRARSLGRKDASHDRLSGGYRPNEVYRATRANSSEEIAEIDYSGSRRRYSGYRSSSREKGGARNRADFLEHSEYFTNVLRIGNNAEDIWKDIGCDTYENVTRSMKSANLVECASREINARTSFENVSASSCKRTRANNAIGRVSRKKNRQVDTRKGHSVISKRRGQLVGRKRGSHKPVVSNNHKFPRISRNSRRGSVECESDSKVSNVIVDTRDTVRNVRNVRERCDCGARHRFCNFTNTTDACKGDLKSTAIAIMRDIQAHIDSAENIGNVRDRIPEIPVGDPGKKRDQSSNQDLSMGYDWECDDAVNDEDSLSTRLKQLSASADSKVSSTMLSLNRRRRKKRLNRLSIDCKFIDRTETTYQSAFHKCVDLESSTSMSSLKINPGENWGSEDSDVGAIHSSWPRSSLTEGCGDEFDALSSARKNVNEDVARNEEYHGDEQTAMSTCYKYRETPGNFLTTRRRRRRDPSASAAIGTFSDDPDDAKFVNRSDPANIITYRNKKKSVGGSSLIDGKSGFGKVRTRVTRNAADRNKVDLIRRGADDKGNDAEYDSDNGNEYAARRMTRASTKIKINEGNCVGRLVWGYCSGWWPALIVDAEHVGMVSEPGKLWVYWIGESQISLLNEKTQIESFSKKLDQRLMQKFRKTSRSQAVDETIQMLRQRYECTLTKPYYYWIRRNIPNSEELDNLNFYPYPSKIRERLNVLKEKNAKATKKYILSQRNSPEPIKKQVVEKTKDTKILKQMEDERLPLQEQNSGIIAWAKISGHNWWPAMIIDYRDCCLKEPNFGCQWIMWYGDYTVSQVHHLSFLKFHKGIEKMRDYIQNTKKHLYLVGVLQASKDYCSRLGCNTDNWTLDNVFEYFSDMNNTHVPRKPLQVSESNKVYDKYSDEIVKKINELKADPNVDDKRKNYIEDSDALRHVMLGKSTVEKLCLKCLKFPKGVMEEHPFFIGSLCRKCSNLFKPCMFVFGNDGKCFYCTVCAATGIVVICDREDCPRVYCTACLKFLICPEVYDDMLLEDPWECFLCRDESSLPTNGLLRPRLDWKERIIGMFRTSSNSVANDLIVDSNKEKRSIRVLSLFDGLSTGLLVLSNLGIVIDVYYASEIDKDALMISTAHFGDRVKHLGDVRNIKKEQIKEIAPIDLLIGGSPCNDLSLVNPARLGLENPNGTGILFFEYCRIIEELKQANKGRHLFWLYENVAAMPSEYRLKINAHLGQEPVVIDSADFSPQHRLRLYWHNLPLNPYFPLFQTQQDVQDILTPHCNRYALVKKIRTVTTRTNSLRQGKSELKPIMMKGESDTLWITELEEIFGFPRHYTDVRNLSATSRQKLIGKSWSVQTLTAILRPLCSFFKCNKELN